MKLWYSIFAIILAFSLVYADEEDRDDKGFTPKFPTDIASTKTLKKFVKLVEQNKMNVTVIISKVDRWNDDSLQDIVALRLALYPNNKHLTNSQLTKEDEKQFVKIATSEKLTAFTINEKRPDDTDLNSNNPVEHTEVVLMNSQILHVEDYDIFEDKKALKNLGFHFTFVSPDNETTEVYGAELEINVKESLGLKDDEVEKIKTIARNVFLGNADIVVPEVFTVHLNTELPDNNWNVFENSGDGFWATTKKFISLETKFGDYVAFAAQ